MMYFLVRPIAKLGLKVFFRHIHVYGIENIPNNVPVIIAANHPTAFIDPCLATCFQKRILNFIVRGDIFKNPMYIKILKSLNLIPIFRFKDGYANLKNNHETFKYCFDVLKNEEAIFILAEGRTIQGKRLRPVQKGPARMAFGAYENFGTDNTVILPMGFTYERANEWRKDVLIECGEPILIKDYIQLYKESPNQAIQSVTDDLSKGMQTTIVHLENLHDDEFFDHLAEISINEQGKSVFPIVRYENAQLTKEKSIAAKINQLNADAKTEFQHHVNNYFKLLNKFGLSDLVVANVKKTAIIPLILYALGLLICLPALLFYAIPICLAKTITLKRVHVLEFKAPVLYALSTFLCLLWNLLLLLLSIVIFGLKSILALVLIFFMAFIGMIFYEKLKYYFKLLKYKYLPIISRKELQSQRNQIIAQFGL